MARPTTIKRHPLSRAVIAFRFALGDTQQQFAHRLGMAIATVARYETSRKPRGKALVRLAQVALEAGLPQFHEIFAHALLFDLAEVVPLALQTIENRALLGEAETGDECAKAAFREIARLAREHNPYSPALEDAPKMDLRTAGQGD